MEQSADGHLSDAVMLEYWDTADSVRSEHDILVFALENPWSAPAL